MEISKLEAPAAEQRRLSEELRVLKWTLGEAERDIFLITLLHGVVGGGREIRREAARLGIKLNGSWFGVVLFKPESLEASFLRSDANEAGERFKKIGFLVRNIAEELADNMSISILAGRYAGMIPLIVSAGGSFLARGTERADLDLRTFAKKVAAACSESCGIELSAAISLFHDSTPGIRVAYSQALEVIDYLTLLGLRREVASYEQLSFRGDVGLVESLSAAAEREHRLKSCVQIGDFTGAQEILHEMIDSEFIPGSFTIQSMNCRLYTLLNNFVYAVEHMRLTADDDFFEVFDPMPRVLSKRSISDIREQIDIVFESFFQNYENTKDKAVPIWLAKMAKFIDANYYDPDLSATMIADSLGLNPAYSARVFKQYYGSSVLDYIHKVRLAEAAKLMGKGMLLKDIARMIGYDNPLRMNRAFHRYEGFAPHKMNEAMRKNDG